MVLRRVRTSGMDSSLTLGRHSLRSRELPAASAATGGTGAVDVSLAGPCPALSMLVASHSTVVVLLLLSWSSSSLSSPHCSHGWCTASAALNRVCECAQIETADYVAKQPQQRAPTVAHTFKEPQGVWVAGLAIQTRSGAPWRSCPAAAVQGAAGRATLLTTPGH